MRELLAPAGDENTAKVALLAGADAVYLGMTRFSARSAAQNLDGEALARVAEFAHLLGAKAYVALNTLVKDGETEDFFSSARLAWACGADALLLQDIFLGRALKAMCPEMVLHLSTQGGCCNEYGARVAKEYGFSRVVLARETPLAEIARVSKIAETECFVQGALCTSFSGQCYFSSFAGNNSGNRGRCKQPCRKKYKIDGMGCEKEGYALSTCDLCVGKKIEKLAEAGVVSFKIEGRMRRPEYVAAAVKYYRALLGGEDGKKEFPALVRAYNRGDYTRGLAFGQEHFLSRLVQGHIGERVGEVSLRGGKYFCKSAYPAGPADGFKILRGGREVCGALSAGNAEDGFYLSPSARLLAGDEVRLTTDARTNAAVLSPVRARKIEVKVRLVAGEVPQAECEGLVFRGDATLERGKTSFVTEEEAEACFKKCPAPLLAEVTAEAGSAFMPKSALNGFRRGFYEALIARLAPQREPAFRPVPACKLTPVAGRERAEIVEDGAPSAGIAIRKPRDYARLPAPHAGDYLYLPPFLTTEEAEDILSRAEGYEGIYCEGYYGLALAEAYQKKLFAGTGFNLTNRYAAAGAAERAEKFALSKELSSAEQGRLAARGAFALAEGAVKVMDLIYCPFEKRCGQCDGRVFHTLTDEDGRAFPLRKYRVNGQCRFEVYNCAPLKAGPPLSCLCDRSAAVSGTPTKGHAERSML